MTVLKLANYRPEPTTTEPEPEVDNSVIFIPAGEDHDELDAYVRLEPDAFYELESIKKQCGCDSLAEALDDLLAQRIWAVDEPEQPTD